MERAILSWIAERNSRLAAALRNAAAFRREHSEAGSYTYLSHPEAAEWTDRVDGPQIESPHFKHGAGCILWLNNSVLDCLEVYTFGDKLPVDLDEFTLSDIPSNNPVQPTRATKPIRQREPSRHGPRG